MLGADGAGAFAIALTIVYVLLVLTTLGVEHGIAYYVSGGSWAPRRAFRDVAARRGRRRADRRDGRRAGAAGVPVRVRRTLPWRECALAAFALPFALAWFYGSFVALADDHYEGYVLPPALQSSALLVLGAGAGAPGRADRRGRRAARLAGAGGGGHATSGAGGG